MTTADWFIIIGLGALWLGAQIVWVAPRPRQLRNGEVPTAPKGSNEAFMLFWLDQYGWLGISLCSAGLIAAAYGVLSQ